MKPGSVGAVPIPLVFFPVDFLILIKYTLRVEWVNCPNIIYFPVIYGKQNKEY